ncbi:MAG TPA: hypothetical protein VF106_41030 [Actinophytocola sp.]
MHFRLDGDARGVRLPVRVARLRLSGADRRWLSVRSGRLPRLQRRFQGLLGSCVGLRGSVSCGLDVVVGHPTAGLVGGLLRDLLGLVGGFLSLVGLLLGVL